MTKALAAALLAALLLAGWQWGRATQARAELDQVRASIDRQIREAEQAARATETRRTLRLQENVDAAYLKQRQAESDARGLRAARDGMLAAAEAAGAAACHPATAADGQAGAARAVVPADLFRSIEERAEQLAGAADAARIAGQLCERAYGALIEP